MVAASSDAVGLGLGGEAAGLLAQHGELGRQAVGLEAGLVLQLVGHLLRTRQQGGRRGLARGGRGGIEGHVPPSLRARSEVIVAARRRT